MTETLESHGHHGPTVQTYLVVGDALGIFTIVSFIVNYLVNLPGPKQEVHYYLTAETGFLLILGVAVVKALLVAAYFMHLKYDWFKVGFMIIPALILGVMMMLVLLPDTVLAWEKFPHQADIAPTSPEGPGGVPHTGH